MQQQVYTAFSSLEDKHWWFIARRQYIKKIISHFFSDKDVRFCEIGCGTGGNLPMLSAFGKLDAVEMNDEARATIDISKISNLNSLHAGYLPDDIPLTESYDGVFTLDVIEHVEDDSSAVRAIKPLIKNNGYLVLTVPAYQWLWSSHDEANHHYRRYTKRKIERLLNDAGYTIEYSSYFNTLLFPLAAISRIVAELFKLSKNSDEYSLKMPSRLTNTLFKNIFWLESYWAGRLKMPFGLSIIVVAKMSQ